MKKILLTTSLAVGIIGLSACGSSNDTVATTKAGDITKEEFYEELKNRNGEEVLKELVTLRVLEDKYEVSEDEINEEFEGLKTQFGDEFESILEAQGLSEDILKEQIKTGLLQEAAFTDGIEVSEEELKDYYDRMNKEVKARHILVEDEETAKKIVKELKDGGNFKKLAEKHSIDESSAVNGGDIGFFEVGTMVPEFEEAAFTLKKNKVSDPVQSSLGYHIIEVLDTKEKDAEIGSFEEEKSEIRRAVLERKIDPVQATENISKILKEADIKIKEDDLKDIFAEELGGSTEEDKE